ncbi:hypothetical protein FKB36_08120 [Methanoculleus sp. Afa-1]|uniref:Antitoxin n=1 Tax=Methanoculleus formosensis TaxID=2590886 RepID=A0A9E4ZNH1_9EURY|nr:hypothetical protein [Methanoculleus sp. Afa-1]MCT8337456.1 hypothetical protein [Methanoculleus sp. Afa-1]
MQTIEVSDMVYQEILSRRKGRESISKTLERELMPKSKTVVICETAVNVQGVDEMVRRTNKEKTYTSQELRAKYGV